LGLFTKEDIREGEQIIKLIGRRDVAKKADALEEGY
jgi:SET domain-containing protein